MGQIDKFLFSKNERMLLLALPVDGRRPRELMRETRIPHASLYLAFRRLCSRGLAKRFIKEGKIYWRKLGSISKEVIGTHMSTKVLIYHEKETVKNCINQILALRSGDRITIVEGTQNNSGWFDLFTKQETIVLNRILSNKKIICESILPESYFQEAIPRLGEEWASSYKARPIITYVIKKHLISSDALLIALRNKVIILYAKEVLAIEIENEEIVALIKGMIELIKNGARKVVIDEEFSFH